VPMNSDQLHRTYLDLSTPHAADACMRLGIPVRCAPASTRTLEARQSGFAGIVIWGLHRDSTELGTIRLPTVSLGAIPVGPQRLDTRDQDALTWAKVGENIITEDDFVLGDDDGLLFIPLAEAANVAAVATTIRDTERNQAALMLHGTPFRAQAHLGTYLTARAANAELTFRDHLRTYGAEIEE
jgi:regulator of RNase E activity RraA